MGEKGTQSVKEYPIINNSMQTDVKWDVCQSCE